MNISLPILIVLIVGCLLLGFAVAAAFFKKKSDESDLRARQAEEQVSRAESQIEASRKEALLEAKEEAHRLRQEIEQDDRQRRSEVQRLERRVSQRDEQLDRRQKNLDKRERNLQARESQLQQEGEALLEIKQRQLAELERISELPIDQARSIILERVEEEMKSETALLIRQMEEKARDEADKRARKIVALAIQRCAVDQATETTVSVVPLASDDLKGRIIGREGRNIRAFESLTGVDLIIDDTPEAVVISCFDPVRREIARTALSNLVVDGRIHPGRIEDVVNKARSEIHQKMREAADRACLESKVSGLAPPIMETLGKLLYRTSYGQNILWHSVEVSLLAGMIAGELGANVNVCKRAGLLHDIGKGLDHQIEGTHVDIGLELLKRGRESEAVIQAVAAHHEDIPPEKVEDVIVIAADAISSARPGARREMLETYVQRLHQLETIADSFTGVEKAFAIQAGREIRVIVKPEAVDDLASVKLARDVAQRIEQEMQYPGEIKVTVIRETRSVDFAR